MDPCPAEEYFSHLWSIKKLNHASLHAQQSELRQFNSYGWKPNYGWDQVYEQLFGTHSAQVFFDWITAPQIEEFEAQPLK